MCISCVRGLLQHFVWTFKIGKRSASGDWVRRKLSMVLCHSFHIYGTLRNKELEGEALNSSYWTGGAVTRRWQATKETISFYSWPCRHHIWIGLWSVHASVWPSILNARSQELAPQFFLVFCMKLDSYKVKKKMELDFWKKVPTDQKGPKSTTNGLKMRVFWFWQKSD